MAISEHVIVSPCDNHAGGAGVGYFNSADGPAMLRHSVNRLR